MVNNNDPRSAAQFETSQGKMKLCNCLLIAYARVLNINIMKSNHSITGKPKFITL